MGKRKSSDISEKSKERLNWTIEMGDVFLNSLHEEQDKGNRVDGTWTSFGLTNVARTCTEKFHTNVDKEKVINRRRTLKDNYNICHDLFRGTSGFAWNPETKYFVAEPEVWTDFIKGKPEAAKWRHTPICHYDKLETLFAKDRACGKGTTIAKEKVRKWAANDASDVNSEGSYSLPISSDKDILSVEATSSTTSSKKLKKSATTKMIEKQTEVFQAGILGLTEALKEGNLILKETRPRVYAEYNVYNELIAIGVPQDRLVDSMVYLTRNPLEVRALFGVPSALRKEMLFKLMNA